MKEHEVCLYKNLFITNAHPDKHWNFDAKLKPEIGRLKQR